MVNISETVRGCNVTTRIYDSAKSIVQVFYEYDGCRQNLGFISDDILQDLSGTIAAIFRIHPFKGNLL